MGMRHLVWTQTSGSWMHQLELLEVAVDISGVVLSEVVVFLFFPAQLAVVVTLGRRAAFSDYGVVVGNLHFFKRLVVA